MSDVKNEMDVLERKLAAKTREIEALVATQQNLGDLNTMESTDYARLRTYVEELIYNRQDAKVRPASVHASDLSAISNLPGDGLEAAVAQ